MWSKIIVVLFMLFIVYNLGSALLYMLKGQADSDKTFKALKWRIGLSLLLFITLFVLFALGLITPHGIAPITA